MNTSREMPKYQCHKQVWALKIKTVAAHASGDPSMSDAKFQASDAFQGAHLIPCDDGYAPVHVSADWFRKHKPEAGGYYVTYEDGYKSYSPAAAFESGYTPIGSVLSTPHTDTTRDIASDPHANLCVKSGDALKAASITLPVVDPGPDSLEREIQAKADKGPRVTPADVAAEIAAEYGFTLDKALVGCPLVEGMDRVTIAVLVLKNGTKLVGVNYGAIDPAQHSPEIGAKEARAAAVEEIWPLLGFRLRDELARPVLTEADAAADLAGTPRPDDPTR